MRESEHFNLFLAEGSDIVNPLIQDVQNYENIDEQMFKNQNAGVQNATELKNGTVHAITRNVPDAQFITFTATSNYTAGETFTVDGVQVTALTVSGETLPTGAYVINSQVLCVLKGTLLTVYGIGSEVADNSLALNGHPDTYFGTKEEVDNAIDTANAANELVKEINTDLMNLKNVKSYDAKNPWLDINNQLKIYKVGTSWYLEGNPAETTINKSAWVASTTYYLGAIDNTDFEPLVFFPKYILIGGKYGAFLQYDRTRKYITATAVDNIPAGQPIIIDAIGIAK